MHINPDHFLQTPEGRITTPERNARAWEQCFEAMHMSLEQARPGTRLYVLIGAQGSGKSTWADARVEREPRAVIFDAILVKRSERAQILAAARQHSTRAVAVWFRTPLETCLARNAARPPDQVADEKGLRNVFAALEPPSLDEGFAEVHVVDPSDA
jgi:predicted kinase